MKKTLSIVLALVMVLSLLPAAALAATSYKDTENVSAEGKAAIDRWSGYDVLRGNPNGTFSPWTGLTRGQAMAVFSRLLKLEDEADISAYKDVAEGAWYYSDVAKNVAAGIFEGEFGVHMYPGNEINRQEFFVTIARAMGIRDAETIKTEFTDYDSVSRWARPLINALVNLDVVKGVGGGRLSPKNSIQRVHAAIVLDRLIEEYITEDGTHKIASGAGRLTLVVAKKVSLTGAATNMPIVLYGRNGSVDMSGVTGTATVNVMVPGVTVTGARPGTTFVTGKNATGLTVNGVSVPADTTYVVPGAGGGSWGPSGPATYTVTYEDTEHKELKTETAKQGVPYKVLSAEDAGFKVGTDKKFVGWKGDDGNAYSAGQSYDVTGPLVLTAETIETKDKLAEAISNSMTVFNNKFSKVENVQWNGASFSFVPLGFNAEVNPEGTREQNVTVSAGISDDLAAKIIEAAANTAIVFISPETEDDEETKETVDSIIDSLIETLNDKFGLELNKDSLTAKELKDAAYKVAKELSSDAADEFKENGSYIFTKATATVKGSSVVVTTNNGTATVSGSKRDAAKKLATAIAKDLYSGLSQYADDDYENAIVLTSKVDVKFEVSSDLQSYPTSYPFTVSVKLDGGELVSVKWDETKKAAHVKFDASAIESAYNTNASTVVEELMTSEAVTSALNDYIKDMQGSGQSGSGENTFDKLANALEQFGLAESGKGSEKVGTVLGEWLGNNTEALLDSQHTGGYENEAVEQLIIELANAAAKSVDDKLTKLVDNAKDLDKIVKEAAVHVIRTQATPDGDNSLGKLLKNNEALIGGSIDLSALEALEDAKLDIYVYAVICDQMRATEGISSNFAGSYHSQMTEAVKKLIEDNLTSVLEDKDNELAQLLPTLNSLETLKDTAQLTLGQLRDFIGNKTVHSMLNGSGESSTLDNAVTRFKNALNRLPANASVTVKVGDNSYTLDTDDLKTLQNGLVSGFQELVNETNGALKLADFDVEDGLEVTVKYNTRTFVFYLWIDGLTA